MRATRQVRALQADLASILAAGLAPARPDRRRGGVARSPRRAVPPQRRPAGHAGVEHEDPHACRRGRTTGVGLHLRDHTPARPGPSSTARLQGDLVVRGTGDPSLNARQVSPIPVLDAWADLLAARGIRRIAGRLVGDDNAFDEQSLGQGWSWDDLQEGYAAPIGALQVYEDAVTLRITPGEAPGLPGARRLRDARQRVGHRRPDGHRCAGHAGDDCRAARSAARCWSTSPAASLRRSDGDHAIAGGRQPDDLPARAARDRPGAAWHRHCAAAPRTSTISRPAAWRPPARRSWHTDRLRSETWRTR